MKRILIALATILALLSGISAYFLTRTNPIQAVEPTITVEPITASELHRLVNLEREKVGIAPLTLDERLNQSALGKATDMHNDGYFDHVDPVTGKHGYEYIREIAQCYGGENLAGLATQFTSAQTVQSWYDSPSHRAGILNIKSTKVGYAVYGEYIVMHAC